MAKKQKKSYLMMTAAMMIWGSIGIFRKLIPISSGLLVFLRGILGALSLLLLIKFKKAKVFGGIDQKNLLLLILLGIMIGMNWMLLFEAYHYTSVATATLCYYMQPTIIILAAPIFFKEKLTVKKLCCAAAGIVGMIFVSGILGETSLQVSDIKGILFGLGAAVLYAAVVMMNKRVQVENVFGKTVIQLFCAAFVMVPYLVITDGFSEIQLNVQATVMILILGIVHTGMAYAFYFSSLRGLEVQSAAMLSYIDPAASLILSALILHESLSLAGILGAVLIIGSALVSEIDFGKRKTMSD